VEAFRDKLRIININDLSTSYTYVAKDISSIAVTDKNKIIVLSEDGNEIWVVDAISTKKLFTISLPRKDLCFEVKPHRRGFFVWSDRSFSLYNLVRNQLTLKFPASYLTFSFFLSLLIVPACGFN
jgi:tricorn protease-like protein